jgi:hypothetical protein
MYYWKVALYVQKETESSLNAVVRGKQLSIINVRELVLQLPVVGVGADLVLVPQRRIVKERVTEILVVQIRALQQVGKALMERRYVLAVKI